MSSAVTTLQSLDRIRASKLSRGISTWVAISFVGSLIICCELFAMSSVHAAEKDTTETHVVSSNASHGHDHSKGHGASLSSVDDALCADNSLPKLATLTYLPSNSTEDSPFIVSVFDETRSSFKDSIQIGGYPKNPNTGSPPLYLLFNRLLVAHNHF